MSPLLLEPAKIIKLVLLYISSVILAFSSGYFLAYQPGHKNQLKKTPDTITHTNVNKSSSQTVAGLKPEKPQLAVTKKKQSNQSKITSSKKISQKKQKTVKKKPIEKKSKTVNKIVVEKKQKSAQRKPLDKSKKESLPKNLKKPIEKIKNNNRNEKESSIKKSATNILLPLIDKMPVKVKIEKTFSIQVGAFSNQINAQKLVDEINVKNFDAFISEYVSAKGVVKYNVRIGKYDQRSEGRDHLAKFKKLFVIPAYIIVNP